MINNTWASLFWILTQVINDIFVSLITVPFILPGIVSYYLNYLAYFIMVNSASTSWDATV
jgi:hypothetical protein